MLKSGDQSRGLKVSRRQKIRLVLALVLKKFLVLVMVLTKGFENYKIFSYLLLLNILTVVN